MLVYRLLLTLAAPVVALRLARRRDEADERLGGGAPAAARKGATIWVHAASNGEAAAARPLIEAMLACDPKLALVVTCNSATGRALVAGWGLARVTARLAPLDYRRALSRFLANWQPEALIVIENELWPNRLAMMADLKRPVLVLGARMSPRSLRRWQRFPSLARGVIGRLSYVAPQDAASRERFLSLGVDEARLGPVVSLKSGAGALPYDEAEYASLLPRFPHEATLLAASTHEGEERVILRGFAQALARRPAMRLILAPRHPRRAPEIVEMIKARNLTFAQRSAGEVPGPETSVYLADTMGEMPLWYALAGITFVGGSLVDKGGHTPFEPVSHGSALLHGPHVANFADAYAALAAAGASRRVDSADALAEACLDLDRGTRARMAKAAVAVIVRMQDSEAGLAPLVTRIGELAGLPALSAHAETGPRP